MRTRGAALWVLGLLALLALPGLAAAQGAVSVTVETGSVPPAQSATEASSSADPSLLARFGEGVASRLLQSSDPDDRVRGIDRAAGLGTPKALTLLLSAAGEGGAASTDPFALAALVRGLAAHAESPDARAALIDIVRAPATSWGARVSFGGHSSFIDESRRSALVTLAQEQAAMALAAYGDPSDAKTLLQLFRQGGQGASLTRSAIEVRPPNPRDILAAGPLTASTAALTAAFGDARGRDALLAAAGATDIALRCAALDSFAVTGDARGISVAESSQNDVVAEVRIAAAGALVALRTPDADSAVARLIADDVTAGSGLFLAATFSGFAVTRAAAARLAASSDSELRLAAIAALGAQTSPDALHALSAFASDPKLAGHIAIALARSPDSLATSALAALAHDAPSRRLVARAAVVRRYVLGRRSAALDALVDGLARSTDGTDRAVGVFGQVAFGDMKLERALSDPDPRVRRAGAMAAVARLDERSFDSLNRRLAVEKDAPTRIVLAAALLGPDRPTGPSRQTLLTRVDTGSPDAAPAAFALGRRVGDASNHMILRLLAFPDASVRAAFARGLGASPAPDATSLLASAYRSEVDLEVRRAIVAAIQKRAVLDASGAAAETLRWAAMLDPDPVTRAIASPADHSHVLDFPMPASDLEWIQLETAEGSHVPDDADKEAGAVDTHGTRAVDATNDVSAADRARATHDDPETGAVIRSDGLAMPVAFDDDGYALVFVPPGAVRLQLAPRLPSYSAPGP